MSVPVDSPQHSPGFLMRFWLFLVKLVCSFTNLFRSDPTSIALPPPVVAENLATRHRATPLFRWLTQKNGFPGRSQVLTATETHEDFVQPYSSNDRDPSDNLDELGTKPYNISCLPGFICPPQHVFEDSIARAPAPFSIEFAHSPSSENAGCCDSIISRLMDPDSIHSSRLLCRRVSFGAVSICRSPTGSILSISPVRHRLLGIPPSIDTPLSPSELVHNVRTPPLAIRRGFSGGSVKMPRFTIRLESPWSPSDKTLPMDVWMNPKGLLVNAHGSLGAPHSSQAVVLQYIPHANLGRTSSSWITSDEGDSASLHSFMIDLAEEGYAGRESNKHTSHGYPVYAIGNPDNFPPPSEVVAITTPSAVIRANPLVITPISTLDSIRTLAEDIKFTEGAHDRMSSELYDGLPCVVSESRIDVASDDQTPGLAYIPSLRHTGRPLTATAEPLRHTDRAIKSFSVPYLSPVHEPSYAPLRASASSSSKSFSEAVEDRNSRALADLISLLDLAALQTAETTGVSEIRMGNYSVRAT